jgi:hypothetical protein
MLKVIVVALLGLALMASVCYAEWVSGYTRTDGTYVNGYFRSDSNSTVRDNYSYKSNVNPYTGEEGHNYYRTKPTSEYYGTSGTNNTKNDDIFKPYKFNWK